MMERIDRRKKNKDRVGGREEEISLYYKTRCKVQPSLH